MLPGTPPNRAAPIVVTRFAPSPTGLLHLGHARAALFASEAASRAGGRFLVRIEDIDRGRCRPEFEAAILEDLTWLGLAWEQPVRRQSEHLDDHRAALDRLARMGLLYPCTCTRAEIRAEIERAHGAPQGDGAAYPGTCRPAVPPAGLPGAGARDHALRLDAARAMALAGPLRFVDAGTAHVVDMSALGDIVLARKDMPTSYHLAVTVDDAIQGVSLVTRGEDLLPSTHVHRLLQALLELPVPAWHHHPLLTDETGRRLAKRDNARSIRSLRESGASPAAVRRLANGD